jgi:hypothetical protein
MSAAILRSQARWCHALAAGNADPRIRAELTRVAEGLTARADAAPDAGPGETRARDGA